MSIVKNNSMFGLQHDDNSPTGQRRRAYLRLIYILSALIHLFFIIKYNFQYKATQFNFVLLPLYVIIHVGYFIYLRTRIYFIGSLMTFLSAVLMLIFLIGTAGGFEAPGIFWLSAIPITGGILWGIRGVYFGGSLMTAALITYWLQNKFGYAVNIVAERGLYPTEKAINVVLFFIYSIFTTRYFIRTEEKALVSIENTKQEIDTLLRILMHDLGTPLTVVLYGVEAIKRDNPIVESHKSFVGVNKSIKVMTDMIAQIREMRAIKDGKREIKLTPIDIVDLVRSTVDMLRDRAGFKAIVLSLNLPEEPILVALDELAFSNYVLANLLTNAIKFSHPNSKIDITVKIVGEENVLVCVRDYGVGIPKGILKDLFNINKATSRKGTGGEAGTGYGMPLVYEITQKLKGIVTVDTSEETLPGRPAGTEFILQFKKCKGE